jgi:hypothetical protein
LEFDDVLKKQNYSEKVEYISLRDNLCNSSGCLVKVGPTLSKDLLVFDSAHLTESGAANVTEKILATAIK